MTAKINIMMHSTNVRLPKAPIVLPMIEINKFNVGQDFANLKTLSCNIPIYSTVRTKQKGSVAYQSE